MLQPTDEAFLLVFNHRPTVAAEWTKLPRQLSVQLKELRPFGGTAIYDAMLAALPLFDVRAHQRSAIVLISDGADTASDADVREVRAQFRQTGPFVYAIAIDAKTSLPINDRVNPYALREMTDESGGYTEVVHDSSELTPATQRIADELNHQYTLAYTPTRPPDGRYPPHPGPRHELRPDRAGAPRLRGHPDDRSILIRKTATGRVASRPVA